MTLLRCKYLLNCCSQENVHSTMFGTHSHSQEKKTSASIQDGKGHKRTFIPSVLTMRTSQSVYKIMLCFLVQQETDAAQPCELRLKSTGLSEERQEADKPFDPRWSTEQWWLPQMWVKGTLDWLLSLVCSTGEVSFTSISFLGSPVNSYKGRCWDLTGKGHKATLGICFLASPDGYTVTSTIFLSESPDAKTDFIICKLLSMKFLHKETSHFKSNLPKLESFMCSLPSSHPLDSFIKQNGNNNATLRT